MTFDAIQHSSNNVQETETSRLKITAAEIFGIVDPDVRRLAATKFSELTSSRPDSVDLILQDQEIANQFQLPVKDCGHPLPSAKDESVARSIIQVQELNNRYLKSTISAELGKIVSAKTDNPLETLLRLNQLKECQPKLRDPD